MKRAHNQKTSREHTENSYNTHAHAPKKNKKKTRYVEEQLLFLMAVRATGATDVFGQQLNYCEVWIKKSWLEQEFDLYLF